MQDLEGQALKIQLALTKLDLASSARATTTGIAGRAEARVKHARRGGGDGYQAPTYSSTMSTSRALDSSYFPSDSRHPSEPHEKVSCSLHDESCWRDFQLLSQQASTELAQSVLELRIIIESEMDNILQDAQSRAEKELPAGVERASRVSEETCQQERMNVEDDVRKVDMRNVVFMA
eukprot:745808-Hanusia_phi.AAC.1